MSDGMCWTPDGMMLQDTVDSSEIPKNHLGHA